MMGYSHCMSLSLYIVVLSNITQTWAHCPARELLWGRHRAANNCPGLTDSEMAEGTPMDWKPPNDLASEVCHFRLNTKAGTELKSKWLASELLPSRLTSKVMLWTCFFTFTWLSMFKARQCGNTVPNERDKQMAMTSSSSWWLTAIWEEAPQHPSYKKIGAWPVSVHSTIRVDVQTPGCWGCSHQDSAGWLGILNCIPRYSRIPGSQDLMYMFSLPLGSGWIRMDQVPGQETSRLTTCAEPRWPKVEASAVQWTQSPDAVNGPCPQTFVLHLWVGRRRPATQKWQRFFQGTLLDLDLMTGDISMTSLIISIIYIYIYQYIIIVYIYIYTYNHILFLWSLLIANPQIRILPSPNRLIPHCRSPEVPPTYGHPHHGQSHARLARWSLEQWDRETHCETQICRVSLKPSDIRQLAVWPCGQAFGLRHIMLPVLCRVAYRFSLWIQLAPSLSSCQVQPQVSHCPDKSPWKIHTFFLA